MRLEYLTYLKMIARSNSISTAANACFISHQALSKAMKSFEEELGIKLLLRTNQGVKLTEEGEYVLGIANQVLPLLNELENHFSLSETAKLTGSLNILSIPLIRDAMLKKSISLFYKRYPNVHLSIENGDTDVAIPALLNNEIDLAFFSIVTINHVCLTEIPKELEFVPFSKYRFNALLSKNSPLANFSTISISQLLAYPVILMPTTELYNFNPYKILSFFGDVNIRFAASYDLYDQFLDDDLGVSIAPDLHLFDKLSVSESSHIERRPISDNVYGTMGYIFNKNNNNPYIKQFLNIFDNN